MTDPKTLDIAELRQQIADLRSRLKLPCTTVKSEVLSFLLDRVEAAERALVCADAYVHHSTHDNYEDYKSARSQCPALLRGKENEA